MYVCMYVHQYGEMPNRNLSHNDPATSMLQRENRNRALEIELTYVHESNNKHYVCMYVGVQSML